MELLRYKTKMLAPCVALASLALSACGATGSDMDGAWVTASMNDAMECSMGRVMVIDGDRIDFGIAGQVVQSFEGLQTEAAENGNVVMRSDSATFEFRPGATPDEMTIVAGPMVFEHHTSRLPMDLGRCGG
ncbi:hypothetical protein [Aurantiacibacter gilvus]|uniref:Lipoprotein n=1 Tax=Aurantiacibacter gilvus TaxID=3139141 RepID=A0ABU9IFT1_9SPHN